MKKIYNFPKKIKSYLLKIYLILYAHTNLKFFIKFRTQSLVSKLKNQKSYKGLAFGRSIFNEDIKAINTFSKKISIDTIDISMFSESLKIMMKKSGVDKPLSDIENFNQDDYQKKVLKKITKTLLMPILKKNNYKFIISGNYNYLELQEIHNLAKDLSIPYIILYKEGISLNKKISKKRDISPYYKIPFKADKLITYNNEIKNSFLSYKIDGINKKNIIAHGIPRFDFIFMKSISKKIYKSTFFSPYPPDKINFYDDSHEKVLVEKINDFHIDFIKTVDEFKKDQFIIKTKSADYYKNYVMNLFHKIGLDKFPENLIISSQINSQKLMAESESICGFNSTTLIEAILMEKPIVTLSIKNITNLQDKILLSLDDQTSYWNDFGFFKKYFSSKIKKPSIKKNNELSNLIHTLKGDSSLRVESEIIKLIKEIKAKN
tara:strand:+ start:1005 stop:2303 length:1299 start_codon:yes stop_codon:yes gene_type:complete